LGKGGDVLEFLLVLLVSIGIVAALAYLIWAGMVVSAEAGATIAIDAVAPAVEELELQIAELRLLLETSRCEGCGCKKYAVPLRNVDRNSA